MKEVNAILNSDNKTVYQIGDDIFSSVEEIFKDEDAEYLSLDAVAKYNLIQNILNEASDFLYSEEIDTYDVEDALEQYLESLGDDVLDVYYTNGTWTFIRNGSNDIITDAVLDILKDKIDG